MWRLQRRQSVLTFYVATAGAGIVVDSFQELDAESEESVQSLKQRAHIQEFGWIHKEVQARRIAHFFRKFRSKIRATRQRRRAAARRSSGR